ncbi:hypothetical protein CNYM01_08166, partial [Colletotrichum nymphaeae SA-01]
EPTRLLPEKKVISILGITEVDVLQADLVSTFSHSWNQQAGTASIGSKMSSSPRGFQPQTNAKPLIHRFPLPHGGSA